MSPKQSPKGLVSTIEKRLREIVTGPFPGMTVETGRDPRWSRTVLTFRWGGFDDLLPEERFQRLLSVIPNSFYEAHLRECVWFELGSAESPEEYMKLPRSDDVASRAPQVMEKLGKARFLAALAEAMSDKPKAACRGDLSGTRQVLRSLGFAPGELREAVLVLIGRGANCDCKVAGAVRAAPQEA